MNGDKMSTFGEPVSTFGAPLPAPTARSGAAAVESDDAEEL